MLPISSRLKDVLWSIRRQYGMESDIDRVIPFIAFERNLSRDQFNDLFVTYPDQIPEDFKSTLLARIREAVYLYREYRQTHKGYHRILRGVIFLEAVARHGFDGCTLTADTTGSYRLELKGKKQ